MGSLTHLLLSVTVALGAVELISGYSFQNCIEVPFSRGKSFNCIRRKSKIMKDLIDGLPETAINLTITVNPVWQVPKNSFVKLPNLQNLRLDQNKLRAIEQFASKN